MKLIKLILFFLLIYFSDKGTAQSLNGYWHNWSGNPPYVYLTNCDTSYTTIIAAFALPAPGTTYNMTFTPDVVNQSLFISQVDSLKAKGKKVIISVGGANAEIGMNDTNQRNTFVSSMTGIINTFHFDGVDFDLEGNSLIITGGTIANPIDARVINLINAIKKLMINYRSAWNKKMYVSFAPETAHLQGGYSAFGSIWGSYLPVLHALRDSLDFVHAQLYNSGPMAALDNKSYYQGTADFIVAMTEMVIHGFNTAGGYFTGLSQNKIAVGLPACINAAGGGFTNIDTVKNALLYLLGRGPKPGSYSLLATYPNLGGMMDWSINWDKTVNYQYARNFDRIFKILLSIKQEAADISKFHLNQNYPNPFNPSTTIEYSILKESYVEILVYNETGQLLKSYNEGKKKAGDYKFVLDGSGLSSGVYFYQFVTDGIYDTKKMVIVK